jgi:predicted Holliday junction resolvase-like endonuclease
MDFIEWSLLILTFINTVIIGGFSILRTYYQIKSLKIQEKTLKESEEYWNSWQERSQNIKIEMQNEMKKEDEKVKESKRAYTKHRANRSKARRDKLGEK